MWCPFFSPHKHVVVLLRASFRATLQTPCRLWAYTTVFILASSHQEGYSIFVYMKLFELTPFQSTFGVAWEWRAAWYAPTNLLHPFIFPKGPSIYIASKTWRFRIRSWMLWPHFQVWFDLELVAVHILFWPVFVEAAAGLQCEGFNRYNTYRHIFPVKAYVKNFCTWRTVILFKKERKAAHVLKLVDSFRK